MSRVGKKPINIPDIVKVSIEGRTIKASGPLGEMSFDVPEPIAFVIENNVISFSRPNDEKKVRALHGLSRALTYNTIYGVKDGFSKTLKIEGIGYKVELKGKGLYFSLGYSHPIYFIPPSGITFEAPNANTVIVKGANKEIVGLVAMKIKKLRPPEPYKGKGIRYEGEYIRRKEGKKASK
jgi:large subunit ribosomal protein L6